MRRWWTTCAVLLLALVISLTAAACGGKDKNAGTLAPTATRTATQSPVATQTRTATPTTGPTRTATATATVVSTATATATVTAGAPSIIPAGNIGRTTCSEFHSVGVAGAPQWPANHGQFADEITVCLGCHQKAF